MTFLVILIAVVLAAMTAMIIVVQRRGRAYSPHPTGLDAPGPATPLNRSGILNDFPMKHP